MLSLSSKFAILSLFAALVGVHTSDSGHSTHGGYYDASGRWVESYKIDLDGNPVEDSPSFFDSMLDGSIVDSVFSYPSLQEHAAMCRQLDAMRLSQRPRPQRERPQVGMIAPERPPPRMMRSESTEMRPARGGLQRGRGPMPDYTEAASYQDIPRPRYARSTTMDPSMGGPPVRSRPSMMPPPESEYGMPPPMMRQRTRVPPRATPSYDTSEPSDHEADLMPRRSRGAIPQAQQAHYEEGSMPPPRAPRIPLSYNEEVPLPYQGASMRGRGGLPSRGGRSMSRE